jgi:hypothetical protein
VSATPHLSLETLLEYWLHDGDAAATDAVDAHLMLCDACGSALDELVALADGVKDAFRTGHLAAVLTGGFVARLVAQGLRVREYRLPLNGSVNCTVSPDDELVVSRLAAPLEGVQRLDAVARFLVVPEVVERFEDVPFDAHAGEVVYVPKIADMRGLPAHDVELTLTAVEPGGGGRELGRYRFHHRPWPGHPGAESPPR